MLLGEKVDASRTVAKEMVVWWWGSSWLDGWNGCVQGVFTNKK